MGRTSGRDLEGGSLVGEMLAEEPGLLVSRQPLAGSLAEGILENQSLTSFPPLLPAGASHGPRDIWILQCVRSE